MDNQIQEILEREIDQGDKAEKAYTLYNKQFIADSYENIHEAFDNLALTDIEGLQTLKMLQSAIQSLEQRILMDMESKDLASRQMTAEAESAAKH